MDTDVKSNVSLSNGLIETIYKRLQVTPEQIMAFCQKWKIIELAVFGSVLRDDFRVAGDDPSDIDLLYVFDSGVTYGFEFFDIKEELEHLCDRKVDLVSKQGIANSRNWLRRKSILESAQVIYGISFPAP
ncbi:nucleotidyltransferase family protein [Roseofilum capinflatum]|uniref:Nucleotidyltransferase domain-containing protein n=1 Tax=Roseofilum capinflatum BLCC-M114 TaxID=3022440 RepID=A0ABT7B3S8_9CYAN|nr:nucleotidyltransferase domain-containing protein [Roseofilum capinflatum]MDJ1173284.1 nucleotidyltransferase domain-containing protein [Roseofilum capinflatum BLCC-M114]